MILYLSYFGWCIITVMVVHCVIAKLARCMGVRDIHLFSFSYLKDLLIQSLILLIFVSTFNCVALGTVEVIKHFTS